MRARVCITGGSGGIGQALLRRALPLYDVKALFRTKTPLTEDLQRQGCRPIWGDLEDESALRDLVDGTEIVFHCAAAVGNPSYAESHAVNVGGTQRLVQAAATAGCGRLIHVSSAAVYTGATTDGDLTEDLRLEVTDDLAVYSRTKLESEAAVRGLCKEHRLEYTIIRPTCVYGPSVKSYTLVPIGLIQKGLPVICGDGLGLMDVVYVDDLAQALILAAESRDAAGQIFNIGHETVSMNEFYEHFGRMLGRPVRHLSDPLLRSASAAVGAVRPGRPLKKGIQFLLRMSANRQLISSAKARTMLGYAPQYPLAPGMLQTELWAKRQKLFASPRPTLATYGPLPFEPAAAVRPSTEAEIQRIVDIAQHEKVRVRTIGSLHSQCELPHTRGVCIVLERYNRLIQVEGQCVTVQAGMTLRDLNEALAAHGLAMPINGSIVAQTVAGAVSTATHGGSIHHGALSDYVERIRLLKADGGIIELDRSHDRFGAAVASLGALGVVSTVTLRCVPAFRLASHSSVHPADDVLRDFDKLNRDNAYVDWLYFPVIDTFEMLSINALDAEQAPEIPERPPTALPQRSAGKTVAKRLALTGLKGAAAIIRRSESLQRRLANRFIGSHYRPRSGRSDLVLAFGDFDSSSRSPGIVRDMEIAVPYERAVEAIGLLRDSFSKANKYPLFPIHIRCSPSSEQWLSPAYKRNVCWLELFAYPSSDTLFHEVHDLLAPFGYRAHWGKETVATSDYLKAQYPRWEDFSKLRREWDQTGFFLNEYLQPYFGG